MSAATLIVMSNNLRANGRIIPSLLLRVDVYVVPIRDVGMSDKKRPGVSELLAIGFEDAAQWVVDGERLKHVGERPASWRQQTAIPNSLYAFVSGQNVLYIGKTTRTLNKRFAGYCDPGKGQATNKKCQLGIRKLIKQGKTVRIHVLPQTIPLKWGDYPINLAAGLEDALVQAFKPEWNGSNGKHLTETQSLEEAF